MSERAAFISAVINNPDDDTRRLAFADWLQEQGEADRAEFVRCQIAAAKLSEAEREASEPARRADELLDRYEELWRGRVERMSQLIDDSPQEAAR